MKKTFYSNGKLLITGEYLVLDGAKAFALPTKFGQNLIVEDCESNEIIWTSYDNDESIWFKDTFTFTEIINQSSNENSIRATLLKILQQAYLLNPTYLQEGRGYAVTTSLTFPRDWGLGTSSTLINNIAQWLEIDAFELLKTSFGGSGYDIACAQNNAPITYKIAQDKISVEQVSFEPHFTNCIYFVYLNQKQNSKTAIAKYKENKNKIFSTDIEAVNNLTTAALTASNSTQFAAVMHTHERIMSQLLETTTIQEDLFSDFQGQIKSLGAWGGDFVMVIANQNPKEYFAAKGYNTFLTFAEMIL
ncbi:GYDIA family GHMP kinase [Flavobacterium frigidarium]|uniref:GYDIA family GHMP kinase n=1 Tax=Flavobacterium frigidarium TaxID=99286 RepID=UPI0030DCFC1B|tara:strand:+ start:4928 stop:5839 length:912 start_codon:yes stop_codon:yes gene_type:complete